MVPVKLLSLMLRYFVKIVNCPISLGKEPLNLLLYKEKYLVMRESLANCVGMVPLN
jgi:hypothetical protein